MRSDLDHLPANKQRELERVVQIVFEEFEDALALASHEWKKKGRILKVILYGSYARGGWVDEPHTAKGYQSDYDLLIIVNDKRLTDRVKYWAKVDDRLMREYGIAGTIKTPVNFIVHTLQEVNDGWPMGAISSWTWPAMASRSTRAMTELHQPKPKTPHAALAMAKEYFEEWMPSAAGSKRLPTSWPRMGLTKSGIQSPSSCERLYHCVLLVVTSTPPRSQSGVPAYPGRTAGRPSGPRLAQRQPQAAGDVREAQGSLRQGALFQALPDHRRGTGLAGRAGRGTRPRRPCHLFGTHRPAGNDSAAGWVRNSQRVDFAHRTVFHPHGPDLGQVRTRWRGSGACFEAWPVIGGLGLS
jgi:predicted nucleotidyltransferase